jgi:DNA-binding CsgD family transcriptional regulator
MGKFTYEERVIKTIEIADYIIENNSSTRKAAEYFKISNATVSFLMNSLLKNIDAEKYSMVKNILHNNTPKTVDNDFIRNRVIKVAVLIKEGFTVEEIAKSMNTTINVINEDLQTRLPRISRELYNEIKVIQLKNSRDNLKQGSNMSVENQKRDENGKFTK